MSLRATWFDNFLPLEEFTYWSTLIPSVHAQRMQRDGPADYEVAFSSRCLERVQTLLPGVQLVPQVDWPVMNQLPQGREKLLHTDPGIISCVYHCSPVWGAEDQGALVITEGGDEVSIEYQPNRLVVFDASLPHLVDPPKRVRHTVLVPFLIRDRT